MEYYSATKENEILPFKTTCMDLEKIMLSEINWTEKDNYYMMSYVESKNNSNESTYKTEQTHRHRKNMYSYRGEGQIRSMGLMIKSTYIK